MCWSDASDYLEWMESDSECTLTRRRGANRPWCTMPEIFVGYNFLKAHPIPFEMTLVSTLTVGAFGRSSLSNVLRMWHVANFTRIA